jgi:diacylglycerol kinase family enzyme
MNLQNAVIFLNRQAGSVNSEALQETLARAFASHGMTPRIELIDPADLEDQLRQTSAPVIIIGGGDGSIRSAAQILVGQETVLGVLPLGTLNHFAKDLGMPDDLEEAVGALCHGEVKTIDVGEVNDHVFINNASLGIYPMAVLLRQRMANRLGLPKYVAMAWAFAKLLVRFPLLTLQVAQKMVHTPLVFVGNNVYEKNPLQNARRLRLDEGVLDVMYLKSKTRLSFIMVTFKGLLSRFENIGELEKMAMTELRVFSWRKRVYVALDGEVTKMNTPLHFRVRAKSLHVIMPPAATKKEDDGQ